MLDFIRLYYKIEEVIMEDFGFPITNHWYNANDDDEIVFKGFISKSNKFMEGLSWIIGIEFQFIMSKNRFYTVYTVKFDITDPSVPL